MVVELDADEGLQTQAQALGIDFGAVAGDHAVAFEPLHAAQAGRGREMHALGQFGVGQAAAALEFGEELEVGAVESGGGHDMRGLTV
ncbi:hypothetical protein GCM10022229_01750 [Luteimonas lutimaris]|uniref:Uncharacterized protein n=1 Tax=Luteimonas lutimaris TaxID=698645 RepID=A0ABP7M5X0_9GAMM